MLKTKTKSDAVSIFCSGRGIAAPTNDGAISLHNRSAEATAATPAVRSATADTPTSVPSAAAHMPVATATALPDEEPDGLPFGY